MMDLSFILMVDGTIDQDSLIDLVASAVPRAQKIKRRSLDAVDNWLEIKKNEDFGAQPADGPDGFLYFRFRLEVTPKSRRLDEQHQVRFASSLQSVLESNGLRVELCASFSD